MDLARLSRVEDASLNASAPPQQLWLDGWLVRLSPGKAKRARSINAVASGRLPLADKLELAAALYREAGLPLVVRVTPFSMPDGLDAALEALGMARFDDTSVMVLELARLTAEPPMPVDCRIEATDAQTYADVIGEMRGSPASQRLAHAERVKASPVPYRGWLVKQNGEVIACGQYAQEADMVGLYDIFTVEAARGRGLARALCVDLLRRAWAQGARVAYLQVDAMNAPARAVYHRLGFADAYHYHYRSANPSAA